MREPALSPQLFAILAALIEEHAGLHYGPADIDLLGEKVETRALESGFDSLLDYYYFLRYDPSGPAELRQLVESVVVQETYFFREVEAISAALEHVVKPAILNKGRARIWSAACSTGEEPLSVAMLLEAQGLLSKVDILATDISQRGLDRAKSGRFRPRSLRHEAPIELARFIERCGNELVVDPGLVRKVEFRTLNLYDAGSIADLPPFDLILCRNVLIYFSDAVVSKISGSLTRALTPGGCLLVGVSESLLRFSTELVCEERSGAFLYLRPE